MWISPEISATLVPIILSLMGAAGIAGVTWLRKLTAQWEAERQELLSVMQEARDSSRENTRLINSNTELTKKIEKNSGGMHKHLMKIARESAFEAGKIQKEKENSKEWSKDELDELEKEWIGIESKSTKE